MLVCVTLVYASHTCGFTRSIFFLSMSVFAIRDYTGRYHLFFMKKKYSINYVVSCMRHNIYQV